jgi:hypothetical protein
VSRSQMFPHKSQGKNFFYLFRGDEFYKIYTLYRKSNLCIPGMELRAMRGLSPNSCIHVSVSDLYIPRIGPHMQNRQTAPRNK